MSSQMNIIIIDPVEIAIKKLENNPSFLAIEQIISVNQNFKNTDV